MSSILTWLMKIFMLPVVKLIVNAAFSLLESKYPGIASFIQSIITWLEGGGNTTVLKSHFDLLPNFQPSDVKKT